MMTRDADKKREQMLMFCMDDMVPRDHLLRKIDKAIDWNFIYDLVEDKYCADNGRPSLDPVLLIKIVFIQYLYGIRRVEYYHGKENPHKLNISTVRKINTLYYYAQRMPSKEVDFRKSNGSGKVLNYLIQSSLKGLALEEKDLFKKDEMSSVVSSINTILTKINTIKIPIHI